MINKTKEQIFTEMQDIQNLAKVKIEKIKKLNHEVEGLLGEVEKLLKEYEK